MKLPPVNTSVERHRFDAKAHYKLDMKDIQKEMAKDIAAFGNANGGHILVGSIEVGGFITAHPGITKDEANRTRKAMENALREFVRPAPVVDFPDPVSVDGNNVVLIVEVQPFPGQAVGVHQGGSVEDPWKFPVRVGTQTVFYSPEQLVLLMDVQLRSKIQLLTLAMKSGEIEIKHTGAFAAERLKQAITVGQIIEIDHMGSSFRMAVKNHAAWMSLSTIKEVWRNGDKWTLSLNGLLFESKKDVGALKVQFAHA